MSSAQLRDFLRKNLPNLTTTSVEKVVRELEGLSSDFEQQLKKQREWDKGEKRRVTPQSWPTGRLAYVREQLKTIVRESEKLSQLIDIVEVGKPFSHDARELLLGLALHAREELKGMQEAGRPRDRVRRHWVHVVADIFVREFNRDPKIWGSDSDKKAKRGPFYELLRLTVPQGTNLPPTSLRRILRDWRQLNLSRKQRSNE